MKIIMKLTLVDEGDKASDCPELDAFKAEHKDLLDNIKKLYDSTSEMLAEGCPDENGHVPLDISDIPDFLGDLYAATLKLQLYIGTLESLLSENPVLLEQEDFMDDLLDLLDDAEDTLDLYDTAFTDALGFGGDNDGDGDGDGEDDWDDGDDASPVLVRFRFDDNKFPEEAQMKAVAAAIAAVNEALGIEKTE